jgi:hypothetical protein
MSMESPDADAADPKAGSLASSKTSQEFAADNAAASDGGDARGENCGADESIPQRLVRIEDASQPTYELILAPVSARPRRGFIYIGAAIAAGMAVGYLLGSGAGLKNRAEPVVGNERASIQQALPWKAEVASSAADRRDAARLTDEIRLVRTQIEQLRRSAETQRSSERLRALETAREESHDALKANAAKLEKLEARLSQLERASADRTPTGSLAKDRVAKLAEEQRAEAKPLSPEQKSAVAMKPIASYVLREVYRGTAIVERRDGLIEEVVRGDELPGAGRVTAIERRGNDWLVVTTKGVIEQRAF